MNSRPEGTDFLNILNSSDIPAIQFTTSNSLGSLETPTRVMLLPQDAHKQRRRLSIDCFYSIT